jgi:outer membrane protein TolC
MARSAATARLCAEACIAQHPRAISESQAVRQAQGRRTVAASELRPQVSSVISETVEQNNLRTVDVESASFPHVVSPFNFFDARAAQLRQPVVDFVRIGNLRSASENVRASQLAARDARDLVVLAVAGSYLQVIAANARIAAAAAQVRTSQTVYQQAVDRLKEGLNARIDTTRSQVQMQIDQRRLRSLVADRPCLCPLKSSSVIRCP